MGHLVWGVATRVNSLPLHLRPFAHAPDEAETMWWAAQLGPFLPHAPGARMTTVEQTPSNNLGKRSHALWRGPGTPPEPLSKPNLASNTRQTNKRNLCSRDSVGVRGSPARDISSLRALDWERHRLWALFAFRHVQFWGCLLEDTGFTRVSKDLRIVVRSGG